MSILDPCRASQDCPHPVADYMSRRCRLHAILHHAKHATPEEFAAALAILNDGFQPETDAERAQRRQNGFLQLIEADARRLEQTRARLAGEGIAGNLIDQAIARGLQAPEGGDEQ